MAEVLRLHLASRHLMTTGTKAVMGQWLHDAIHAMPVSQLDGRNDSASPQRENTSSTQQSAPPPSLLQPPLILLPASSSQPPLTLPPPPPSQPPIIPLPALSRGVTNYLKSRTPALKFCFKYKKSLNLKSYREKPYKTRSHGKEAKQNQELYESSQVNLYYRIQRPNPAVFKKSYKTRSCMKVYSYINLCYKIQLYRSRSRIKPGAVGKKPYKIWSCMEMPHKTWSCMKEYSYINLCYKIQLHAQNEKLGAVGKEAIQNLELY